MKLSVVVPVYNVEKYLDKCLNSLVQQKVDDYEIIVVNDGTKDNSQEIIDRYVEKYPGLVKSLIKENGGLSSARNYGIPYATGDYITFLDSDDYIDLDQYQNMMKLAEEGDLDLVVGDILYEWEFNEQESYVSPGLREFGLDQQKNLFISNLFSWNKIYRRSLFEELNSRYPIGLWYEDIPVTLNFFAHAKKVGYYNKPGYHYLQRKTSILGSSYNPKMFDIFTIFTRVTDKFKQDGLYEQFREELEYLYVEHFLVYGAFRFLRTDHYKELMTKGFDFVKKEFPNYRRNKYLKTFNLKNRVFLFTNNRMTMSFWHWYLTK